MPRVYENMRIGLLTVVRRAEYDGVHGSISNSQWIVRCQCGKEFQESATRIYYRNAYSCSAVGGTCPPKPRKPRATAADWTGKEFGRLKITGYEPYKGWECVCLVCGAVEYHLSQRVALAGDAACRNQGPEEREAGPDDREFIVQVKSTHDGVAREYAVSGESSGDACARWYAGLTVTAKLKLS